MRGHRLILRCTFIALILAGLPSRAADNPVEIAARSPLRAGAFELRLASPTVREGFVAEKWHVMSRLDGRLQMFVASEAAVSGSDVRGVSVTECPSEDIAGEAFGLWVYFREESWGRVRQFSTAHMGELAAMLVNGRIVTVDHIARVFDARIEVCPHADRKADAGDQIVG
jgi:hypothetical protein